MNEDVAVDAKQTDARGAHYTLTLIQTLNVDALGFVAGETGQVVFVAEAQVEHAALLDVTRAE